MLTSIDIRRLGYGLWARLTKTSQTVRYVLAWGEHTYCPECVTCRICGPCELLECYYPDGESVSAVYNHPEDW